MTTSGITLLVWRHTFGQGVTLTLCVSCSTKPLSPTLGCARQYDWLHQAVRLAMPGMWDDRLVCFEEADRAHSICLYVRCLSTSRKQHHAAGGRLMEALGRGFAFGNWLQVVGQGGWNAIGMVHCCNIVGMFV